MKQYIIKGGTPLSGKLPLAVRKMQAGYYRGGYYGG